MEISSFGKLKTEKKKHVPGSVRQTGFSSPATHYLEPGIDLQEELIGNRDATFFIRVTGDGYASHCIYHQDVLIIDRSIIPKADDLVLMTEDGAFKILRMPKKNNQHELYLWGKITYIIHSTR